MTRKHAQLVIATNATSAEVVGHHTPSGQFVAKSTFYFGDIKLATFNIPWDYSLNNATQVVTKWLYKEALVEVKSVYETPKSNWLTLKK